jgi:membrane-bound ClpP family serine protease
MNQKDNSKNGSEGFALPKENYLYLLIGFIIIIVGFVLMIGGKSEDPNVFNENEIFSFRRITLAPIVILAGFIFEMWAIMRKPAGNDETKAE